MHFEEAETDDLKNWLVKRLADISDADSDVLADYVLALVKSDDPEAEARVKCTEELQDFLGDYTTQFVADVFTALHAKSYLPGYVPPVTRAAPAGLNAAAPSFSINNQFNGGALSTRGDQSRKRSYNDRDVNEARDGHDPHYNRNGTGERGMKQMRRGGRGGRGGQNGGFGPGGGFQQPPPPSMPTPPPGFPQLDPNNPMSAILAMQAMGFPALPGFPTFPGPQSPVRGVQPIGERCKDYDTKGYCAAGSMCPYEHGTDRIVVGAEELPGYDPTNASLAPEFTPQSSFDSSRPQRGHPHPRGRGMHRGRGANNGMRGGRATFSQAGPNTNQAITSVVVEQIPQEKFNEDDIREFFAEFGVIEDISLKPYKRLAIIKYKDYASARRAYESPKVIFDNRFVKVYWFKPEETQDGTPLPADASREAHRPPPAEDEEMIDPEEFAEKQAVAQRAHEEKMQKLKEAETAREELEKKIKAQAEERKRLMEKLAAKAAASGKSIAEPRSASPATNGNANAAYARDTPANGISSSSPAPAKITSQTEALRAKLAELEAEAATLGISAEDTTSSSWTPPASTRGRGGYVPFARGGPGYRGRGAPRGGWRGGAALAGGAVARLDNRPRSVEVKAKNGDVDFGDEKILESLRAHIFGIGEFASVTPTNPIPRDPSSSTGESDTVTHTSAIVAFNQRYIAEIFISSSSVIPGIGPTTLSWVANQPSTSTASVPSTSPSISAPGSGYNAGGMSKAAAAAAATASVNFNPAAVDFVASHAGNGMANGGADLAVEGKLSGGDADMGEGEGDGERDYDVAEEDEDRWMR